MSFEYLKDICLSAHPLDKDVTIAQVWGQAGWADYSRVSRTLSHLSEAEVQRIAEVLERVSQPLLDHEVVVALSRGYLELDGDLSPRPVSNTSQTYPEATFGHMNDQLWLDYQAAIVTMRSPTYGRMGLSAGHRNDPAVSYLAKACQLESRPGRPGCGIGGCWPWFFGLRVLLHLSAPLFNLLKISVNLLLSGNLPPRPALPPRLREQQS